MKKITLMMFTFLAFNLSNAQDTCETAIDATAGVTSVGTIEGTANGGCYTFPGGFGAWYSYTATVDGVVTITSNLAQNDGVTNSDDTRLSIFSGTCSALTCIASNDDGDTNYLSTASFSIENGTTYYIHWDDTWSDKGFDFEITEEEITCSNSLPFLDDFSVPNTLIACWETVDADGDGNGWFVADYDSDDDGTPDGNPMLVSASYNVLPLFPDNWLISQSFDFSAYSVTDNLELSWDARGVDASWADENYTVYVATGNEISDFTASTTTFNEIVGENGGDGVFVSRTLDLSAFAGESNVYFAFRHHDVSDQFALNIDNIAISSTLSVKDFESNTFTHYYNSELKTLNLESSAMALTSIEIYSILGQNVMTKSLSNTTESLNISSLTDGAYLAKVNIEGNYKTIKF